MNYTVSDLKTDIASTLHGTDISSITSPFNLFWRAARTFVMHYSPKEMVRTNRSTMPLFSSMEYIVVPDDVKGNNIISLLPIKNTPNYKDDFASVFSREFDLFRAGTSSMMQMDYRSGSRILRIKADHASNKIAIEPSVSTSGFTVANCSSVVLDTLQVENASASIKSSTTSTGIPDSVAFISKTLTNGIDVSEYIDSNISFFAKVWIEDISSVTLTIGSDSNNAYSYTTDVSYDMSPFVQGWNVVRFDIESADIVGTPDASNLSYIGVGFTYSGDVHTVRVGEIWADLGAIYEMKYYSKALFRDSITDEWKEKPTSDNDLINLDTDSYNIYTHMVSMFAAQQNAGEEAAFDVRFFENQYAIDGAKYKAQYKNQTKKQQQMYYGATKPVYYSYGRRSRRN
jgi:hypothetical protein